MNKAHKRTWFSFAISLATILIAAAVILFIRINQIDISEPKIARPLGLLMTILLILIVIISARFPKKNFDERDKLIDRKANAIGIGGVHLFSRCGCLLCVISRPNGFDKSSFDNSFGLFGLFRLDSGIICRCTDSVRLER